jgi:hypothetical protein
MVMWWGYVRGHEYNSWQYPPFKAWSPQSALFKGLKAKEKTGEWEFEERVRDPQESPKKIRECCEHSLKVLWKDCEKFTKCHDKMLQKKEHGYFVKCCGFCERSMKGVWESHESVVGLMRGLWMGHGKVAKMLWKICKVLCKVCERTMGKSWEYCKKWEGHERSVKGPQEMRVRGVDFTRGVDVKGELWGHKDRSVSC